MKRSMLSSVRAATRTPGRRLRGAAAALATATLWAGTAAAACFPIELGAGSRLLVAAAVNGHAVEALLDSAAEMTLIDRTYAGELALAPQEHALGRGSGASAVEAGVVHDVTLEAFGVRLPGQSIAIVNLADVGTRLLHRPLRVILGREIFDAARLQINVEGRTVCVLAHERPRGVRLPLRTEHGIETLPARIEDHAPVAAALDFGNGSQVLVGRAYAERIGLLRDGRPVAIAQGGGLGGETGQRVFTLRSLELAGRRFTDVAAAIDAQDTATDINLGVSVLRHFVVTTDYAHHEVWLLPVPAAGARGR